MADEKLGAEQDEASKNQQDLVRESIEELGYDPADFTEDESDKQDGEPRAASSGEHKSGSLFSKDKDK